MATSPTVQRPTAGKQSNVIVETIRVLVPLLILAAGFGFLMISGSLKKTPTKPPDESGPPRVRTASIAAYDGQMAIEVDGVAVPFRELQLTSEVVGKIKTKSPLCRAGRFVKAGTVLLEIDPADYQLELKRLNQQLRQSEISVHEIDVQLENLKELALLAEQEKGLQSREVRRLTSLVNERVVAQSDLDRARSTEIVSRNAVQQLINEARVLVARRASTRASIELAKTQIEQAQMNLDRTRIVAPVDGVVVRDMAEEGAYVQRGATLVEYEDTSAVEVQCNLMAEEVASLTQGKADGGAYDLPNVPVQVIVQQSDKRIVWDGILSRFDGLGLDVETRMFPCRVLVDEPSSGRRLTTASVVADTDSPVTLVRGMYAQVEIDVPTTKPLAEIPRKALQLGNVIWRIRNGELRIEPVRVVRRFAESIVIELPDDGAISLEDRAVVSPLTTVVDGMTIEEMRDDGEMNEEGELSDGELVGEELGGEELSDGELGNGELGNGELGGRELDDAAEASPLALDSTEAVSAGSIE